MVAFGTLKHGQVELDQPPTWPEGSRVQILLDTSHRRDLSEQENDPASIQAWIDAIESIPPWNLTPDEEGRWHADREAQKQLEKTNFAKRIDGLIP